MGTSGMAQVVWHKWYGPFRWHVGPTAGGLGVAEFLYHLYVQCGTTKTTTSSLKYERKKGRDMPLALGVCIEGGEYRLPILLRMHAMGTQGRQGGQGAWAMGALPNKDGLDWSQLDRHTHPVQVGEDIIAGLGRAGCRGRAGRGLVAI